MRLHITRAARLRAERRLRRAVRAAGILAAAVGLVGASAVAALPAGATTTTMSLRAVGGDRQVNAAWNAVPGATGYTVHWGSGSATNHTMRTTGNTIRIPATEPGHVLRPVTADGTSVASPRRTARPVPYVPTAISSVRAVPAGPDQIRVTWSGGTQARSFAIIAGSDSITDLNHFSTGWHPAALQSWTITIPSRLHDVLGAGSGNAVFVKVALSNSTASDPAKHFFYDGPDKYRVTPSGTWSFAGAATDTRDVSRVQVASWNVQSLTSTEKFPSNDQWSHRITRVVNNIENLHPDLIGMQELTSARLDPTGCHNSPSAGIYHCTEMYQTLQTALGSSSGVAVPYLNAREDANSWLYTQGSNVYVDSDLFYNPARLTVQRSGFVSPRTLMGSAWPSAQADEVGMWAEFSTTHAVAQLLRALPAPARGLRLGRLVPPQGRGRRRREVDRRQGDAVGRHARPGGVRR